ncbi:DUF2855 family protein [bacterium]|nr:DUF2855 family protein [bacterium]
MSDALDFVVNRSDLRQCAVEPGRVAGDTALATGQILLRIDRFAFTANNVTYGAVGDMIGYWDFFPARAGWGRIPVWGFADVLASRHDAVASGERLYGYLPMSTHVLLAPDQATAATFVDAAPHRAALPPIYNQYTRCAADPLHSGDREPYIALFRPLFATAFLLDDFLAGENAFGARQVVLSSASSKTALGLACLLRTRGGARVIGLTAPANAAFVDETGYYDRVVPYDAVETLPAAPTVFVDFAGDGAVRERVHRHLGDRLRRSAQVGVTHWERIAAPAALPGPAPAFFFAPTHLQRRLQEWGPAPFQRRLDAALQRFLTASAWLRIVEHRGPAAVERLYRAMVDGRVDPAAGHICTLSP